MGLLFLFSCLKQNFLGDLLKFILPENVEGMALGENEDCSFAYFSPNPFLRAVFLQRLKEAARFIPTRYFGEGAHVLDIGSGCGYMFPTLSKKGKIVAFDYVVEYLKNAKVLADAHQIPVSYVNGNVYQLPFADNTFSLVNALSVLEHIEDIDTAVQEIERVMKKDGVLIVGVPVERILVNTLFTLLAFKDKVISFFKGEKDNAEYRKNKYQDVHYSDFVAIEHALSKSFVVEDSQKVFFNWIPDAFSLYKVFKCVPKDSVSLDQKE